MSTLSYPSSATETLSLPALQDAAQRASADHVRQQKRLDVLTTTFGKQKGTVTPQTYAVMRAEIEQQQLVCDAALAVMNTAEANRATAQGVEDHWTAERARQRQLETIDAALVAKSAEIGDLQRQLSELPERLLRARNEHMRLQAERAAIAG